MKNSQRGTIAVLSIALIVLVVIVLGAYIFYQRLSQSVSPVTLNTTQLSTNPVATTSTQLSATPSRKTYTNNQYLYQVQYPSVFTVVNPLRGNETNLDPQSILQVESPASYFSGTNIYGAIITVAVANMVINGTTAYACNPFFNSGFKSGWNNTLVSVGGTGFHAGYSSDQTNQYNEGTYDYSIFNNENGRCYQILLDYAQTKSGGTTGESPDKILIPFFNQVVSTFKFISGSSGAASSNSFAGQKITIVTPTENGVFALNKPLAVNFKLALASDKLVIRLYREQPYSEVFDSSRDTNKNSKTYGYSQVVFFSGVSGSNTYTIPATAISQPGTYSLEIGDINSHGMGGGVLPGAGINAFYIQ